MNIDAFSHDFHISISAYSHEYTRIFTIFKFVLLLLQFMLPPNRTLEPLWRSQCLTDWAEGFTVRGPMLGSSNRLLSSPKRPDRLLGAHLPSYPVATGDRVLSSKAASVRTSPLAPFRADVHNGRSLASTPQYAFVACTGTTYSERWMYLGCIPWPLYPGEGDLPLEIFSPMCLISDRNLQ